MLIPESTMRDIGFPAGEPPVYASRMFSTMLTKRRAVDHCRMRSSLCRMS